MMITLNHPRLWSSPLQATTSFRSSRSETDTLWSQGGSWPRNPKKTKGLENIVWLVVSTRLKNISQIGNLPQIGVKIKNI